MAEIASSARVGASAPSGDSAATWASKELPHGRRFWAAAAWDVQARLAASADPSSAGLKSVSAASTAPPSLISAVAASLED